MLFSKEIAAIDRVIDNQDWDEPEKGYASSMVGGLFVSLIFFIPVFLVLLSVIIFSIIFSIDKPSQSATAVVQGMELFIPLAELIDIDDEVKRLEKQISDMGGRLGAVNGKLSNANFVDRAPDDVVDNEKRKQAEYQSSLEKLQENLKSLKA